MPDKDSNPYAPPAAEIINTGESDGIWRSQHELVLRKDAELPARCVYCNEPARLSKSRRIYYLNPWIWLAAVVLFILVNVLALPVLLIALLLRKSIKLEIPYCEHHWHRRQLFIAATLLVLATSIGLLLASIDISTHRQYLFLGGIVLFVAGVVLSIYLNMKSLRAKKIDREVAILKGAGTAFLDSLPEKESF